ncbi:hypothetical protein GCM10009664_59670 [Kitasatospora gansuensis]
MRVVTISTVRAVTEPTIAGTTPENRPATGLNPAIAAYAMPSGMENSPVTRPDDTSDGVGLPSIRFLRLQAIRPTLPCHPGTGNTAGPIR